MEIGSLFHFDKPIIFIVLQDVSSSYFKKKNFNKLVIFKEKIHLYLQWNFNIREFPQRGKIQYP